MKAATHDLVLLVVAAFSRHTAALNWARSQLEESFGPIHPLTLEFAFTQTRYYESTMGTELRKRLYVFRNLVRADSLADHKLRTNALEEELQRSQSYPEERPLNLDPGILSLGKFQLATTKDQSHRIYLRDGIFCEVTLRFHDKSYEPWPWTYADYRQPIVLDFLREARHLYRNLLREQVQS